jgi:general stress protein YciG
MDTEATKKNDVVVEESPRTETKPRGFAALSPEKKRELARLGGKAAHAQGTAHEFSSTEARIAGRRGGEVVARDREYMSRIGRAGARKSAEVRRRRPEQPAAPTTPARDAAE